MYLLLTCMDKYQSASFLPFSALDQIAGLPSLEISGGDPPSAEEGMMHVSGGRHVLHQQAYLYSNRPE